MVLPRIYSHVTDGLIAETTEFFSFLLQNEEANFCLPAYDVPTD